MARLVYLSVPAQGHVNPALPLIRNLKDRGHELLVYNTPEFESCISQSAGQFRAYPPTCLTASRLSQVVQDGNLACVSRLLLEAAEALIPFAVDEIKREAPSAVMFDSIAVWGRVASRLLRVPGVSTIPHLLLDDGNLIKKRPRILLRALRSLPAVPGILRARRRLRKAYGSAMTGKPFPALGDLNIAFTSCALQEKTPAIDQSFRFVGPTIDEQRDQIEFPFTQVEGRPLVYISLGTLHNRSYDFYAKCFEAFRDHPARFVLSVGTSTELTRLRPAPANFIVRSLVPQLQILARATAFISHGGLNSIHEALWYGVPLLLVPQQFEQLANAVIVEERGAGLVLDDAVFRGRVHASDLRAGLARLLDDGTYRLKAAELQRTLRASGGAREAADVVSAYAQREPIPSRQSRSAATD